MPENSNQKTTLGTHLTYGAYGAGIRGGTTFLYANLGDTLRTVSQTQNINSGQVWAAAIKNQGYLRGTFDLHTRGMAPNLLRVSSREAFRAITMSCIETVGLSSGLAKAALMTSIDVLASVPDTIKVLQQSNPEYRNRWLYPLNYYTKGFIPTAVRQGWRWGAIYLIKPQINTALASTQDIHQLPKFEMNLLANLTAASIASFMVLPFDAVKSRIQNGQETGNYIQTVINMVQKDGIKSLLRGGLPKWFITVNAVMNSLIVQDLIKEHAQSNQADQANSNRFFNTSQSKRIDTQTINEEQQPGCAS